MSLTTISNEILARKAAHLEICIQRVAAAAGYDLVSNPSLARRFTLQEYWDRQEIEVWYGKQYIGHIEPLMIDLVVDGQVVGKV